MLHIADMALDFNTELLIEIFLWAFTLYLFILQLLHYRKKHIVSREQTGKKLSIMLAATSGVIFLELSSDVARLYCDDKCHPMIEDALFDVVMIKYLASLLMIYSVLWLRQRSFYTVVAFSSLTNQFTRFVSKYLLAFIIFFGISILVSSIVLLRFSTCSEGCWPIYMLVALICYPMISQLSLLMLFLHPLLKHRSTNNASNTAEYLPLMRRVCVLTATCLSTDIFTIVVAFYIRSRSPNDVNLLSNLLCLIFSTTDWRERIFPCSTCTPPRNPATNGDSNSRTTPRQVD